MRMVERGATRLGRGIRAGALLAVMVMALAACSPGTDSSAEGETLAASTIPEPTVAAGSEADEQEASSSTTVAAAAPEDQPAEEGDGTRPLEDWRQAMESLRGPVDSMAEPFEAAFSYFPDGIDPSPPGQLRFDFGRLTVQEQRDGPFSKPGLDSLRIQATFLSDASSDELVAWMESAYPAGGIWEINASEDRSDDEEQVTVFQVLQPPDLDPGSIQFTLAVIDDDDEVSIQIDFSERDVQTIAPFEDLAGITDALPRPVDAYPVEYLVEISDSSVLYKPSWTLPDISAEDVARDLSVQFPVNGFELVTLPNFDGATDYQIDVECEDTIFCTLRAQEANIDDLQVYVVWTLSFPHLADAG